MGLKDAGLMTKSGDSDQTTHSVREREKKKETDYRYQNLLKKFDYYLLNNYLFYIIICMNYTKNKILFKPKNFRDSSLSCKSEFIGQPEKQLSLFLAYENCMGRFSQVNLEHRISIVLYKTTAYLFTTPLAKPNPSIFLYRQATLYFS